MTKPTAESFGLCTNIRDERIENKSCWVAQLSNGVTVYQDDDRPGMFHPSSWDTLRAYLCEARKQGEFITIDRFYLINRSNVVDQLPQKMPAYFFRKGFAAVLNGGSFDTYTMGYVKEPHILAGKWRTPTLELVEDIGARAIEDGDGLIWNV